MRLLEILVIRRQWQTQVAQVQRMHGWVRAAEHILSGQWPEPGANATNAQVVERFDRWRQDLAQEQEGNDLIEGQRHALAQFLKVTGHLRPWLVRCYNVEGLPRTDNALEDTIRGIKQRYRRISGRKSWNSYLLRYGRYVAHFEWLMPTESGGAQLEHMLQGVSRAQWKAGRAELGTHRSEQTKKRRFRRCRERYLLALEERWGQTAGPAAALQERGSSRGR